MSVPEQDQLNVVGCDHVKEFFRRGRVHENYIFNTLGLAGQIINQPTILPITVRSRQL